MKCVNINIDVIAWFDACGKLSPLKFRFFDEKNDSDTVVKVDNVYDVSCQKLHGDTISIFECHSIINGTPKRYQIKYYKNKQLWVLYKI